MRHLRNMLALLVIPLLASGALLERGASADSSHLLFTFVQTTDSHISRTWHGPNDDTEEKFKAFIDAINGEVNHPRPKYLFFTGDNVEGALDYFDCEEKWSPYPPTTGTASLEDTWRDDFKPLLDSIDPSIGTYLLLHNHDVWAHRENVWDPVAEECDWGPTRTDGGRAYRAVFGEGPPPGAVGTSEDFYFVEGDFLFIVQSEPKPRYEDLDWLQSVLDQFPDKYVFYFHHENPIGDRGPDYHTNNDCRDGYEFNPNLQLLDLLEEHGRVLLTFGGHSHITSAGKQEGSGTRYLFEDEPQFFKGPLDTIFTTIAPVYESARGVYRYVKVYTDRVEVTTHSTPGVRGGYPGHRFTCDQDHQTKQENGEGLAQENDFVLHFDPVSDTSPPTLDEVRALSSTQVRVIYNEPVNAESAQQVSHYAIEPDIVLHAARLQEDGRTVLLETSSHLKGVTYTLIVNGVEDLASPPNTIAPDTQRTYTYRDELIVTVLQPRRYRAASLGEGDHYYLDRDYTLRSIPHSLDGAVWIMTANDDKSRTEEAFLSFSLSNAARVYVGYDPRASAPPGWLVDWTASGETVGVTGDPMGHFDLYWKEVTAGEVTLGGNDAAGAQWPQGDPGSQYVVAIVERSLAGGAFADVPPDHWAFADIEQLYGEGYVAGCSAEPLLYCPEDTMTRAESAVFVVRGAHGAGFEPPGPASSPFEDVRLTDWHVEWVNQLWEEGYTAGCWADPLRYCPLLGHTRAEAAVFFTRMVQGPGHEPGEGGELPYADVPVEAWYHKWVAAAYGQAIVGSCEPPVELGDDQYRPEAGLTRAEAACMMARAKDG